MDVINVGVLTISDRCARREAVDESGPNLIEMVRTGIFKNGNVLKTCIVPDDKADIEMVLKQWSDDSHLHLILTTGGTGLSPRDVTPEATAAILDRTIPGIPYLMFKHTLPVTPYAALSRTLAGVRGNTLIINLPGSRKASTECFEAVATIIPHAIHIINDSKAHIDAAHAGFKRSAVSALAGRTNLKLLTEYPLISVKKAQEIILGRVIALQRPKIVDFDQALDHVLVEGVASLVNHPPFDVSLMDGYAVRSDDECRQRKLIGVCSVGKLPSGGELQSGTCMAVSTGGPIPPGADAVVAVEKTQPIGLDDIVGNENLIEVLESVKAGGNIRKMGFNFKVGEELLRPGTLINAAGVGYLAAANATSVRVFKKPVVAVLSTGDELCNPNVPLGPGCVRDSNRFMLLSKLRAENYETVDLGISSDEPDSLRDSLERGFRAADVVVTTGNMSMGDRDLLKEVIMSDFGGEICFGRVLMKPGKPTAFGVVSFEGQPKIWFGLPGNPASAFVTSELFLLPGLRKIAGRKNIFPLEVEAKISNSEFQYEERPQYLRAFFDEFTNPISARVVGKQCSSGIGSCAMANCLVVVPNISEIYPRGNPKNMKALLLGNVTFSA